MDCIINRLHINLLDHSTQYTVERTYEDTAERTYEDTAWNLILFIPNLIFGIKNPNLNPVHTSNKQPSPNLNPVHTKILFESINYYH